MAGKLVIDNSENTIVVYAFPSSTLKVFLDGELIDEFVPKVPELPPKMTMKDRIKFCFGGPAESQS
ncbi:MAG: hypothetical protein VB875_08155 [Pirellulales bacterium]